MSTYFFTSIRIMQCFSCQFTWSWILCHSKSIARVATLTGADNRSCLCLDDNIGKPSQPSINVVVLAAKLKRGVIGFGVAMDRFASAVSVAAARRWANAFSAMARPMRPFRLVGVVDNAKIWLAGRRGPRCATLSSPAAKRRQSRRRRGQRGA